MLATIEPLKGLHILPDTDKLYEVVQSQPSSGSGAGVSKYGKSMDCGGRGRMYELFPNAEADDEYTEQFTPAGKRKCNGRRAGTFYHKLQEWWRTEKIARGVAIDASHFDYDFEVAVQSFNNYRRFFRNDIHNLGTVVSAEVKYPATPEQEHIVAAAFGELPFTMRYDLLVDITPEKLEEIAVKRQVALPEPGLYLVDYKLVYQLTTTTVWEYSYGFQQLAYPLVYNMCNPDRPVKGMLTDVLSRQAKTPDEKHFGLYLAYADENALKIVTEGIQTAQARYLEGRFNPMACVGKYGPCKFLSNGVCPRFGTFDSHIFFGA